jgi:hypothetical protein
LGTKINKKIPLLPPPPPKIHNENRPLEPSHWLHEISISKMVYHHFQPGLVPPFSLFSLIGASQKRKSKYRSIHEQLLAFSFYLPATDRPLPPTLLSIDAHVAKSSWGAKNMSPTILSPTYVPSGQRLCKEMWDKERCNSEHVKEHIGNLVNLLRTH